MTIEGIERKVLSLGIPNNYEYLIEGVGATNWDKFFEYMRLFQFPSRFLGTELISCHKDGVCLFSKERFDAQIKGTDGVSSAAVEAAGDGAIYDLNGRKVLAPAKGQIYISGGKKAVWQ